MYNDILGAALENGLWAALFCILFLYQLKDSRARESKYATTIEELSKGVRIIKEVRRDCAEIKSDCKEIKSDCILLRHKPRSRVSARVKAEAATNESEG